jgi:hypothetical protein
MILAPILSINGSYGLATVEYNAVVVSGAGSTEINGTYTMTGTHNGKPYYNKGGLSVFDQFAISNSGAGWEIYDEGGDILYETSNNPAFPWLVTSWVVSIGVLPVPELTPTTV